MIGIFDSGYGGLTVMKEIVKALPQYDYLYLGDNARTPYGNHSKETVTRFTEEGVRFLFEQGARLVIFACFTATSLALRELQEKYLRNPASKYKDRKILGVVQPIVEKAVQISKGHIGVVGTRATINSAAFDIELKKLNPKVRVSSRACPLLVPFIEEHWHEKPEARMVLRKYLRPLKSHHIDTLILGCTHYSIMMKHFKKMMGGGVNVLDSGKIISESLADYLKRHPEIESQLTRKGTQKYVTTDDPEKFKEFARLFLKMPVTSVLPAQLH